ncbi:MAG: bifunctional enoyl-CoA hydratase/phosphate acetyltransferase [Hyphomicrobiales bacterium]
MNDLPVPHPVFKNLIEQAQRHEPIKVAVVHPCDATSLESVVSAKEERLIDPILVGPEAKIRNIAQNAKIDLSGLPIEPTAHSHAAAARAVELVREGRVAAMMKGSLHTDELMSAIVDHQKGLRTERRISHCFVMATRGHNHPLIVTDAAINIAPTLSEKADIVQNAIDLAHAIGVNDVRVALLSATETVNAAIPSTIEAAALCKMADRGQITGATLDGPLALDNAIDMGAVKQKQIVSPVAGRANVLVVPDLVSGNILAKTLSFMVHAEAAGVVVGARVPIILTSRADSEASRVASCALAMLMAHPVDKKAI